MGSIVQGIQFSFIGCKSSGELLHSIVPIVNNILYIVYMPESKRKKEKCEEEILKVFTKG